MRFGNVSVFFLSVSTRLKISIPSLYLQAMIKKSMQKVDSKRFGYWCEPEISPVEGSFGAINRKSFCEWSIFMGLFP
jgi:hypothetical protein